MIVNKGSALDQLRLALAWRRVDIAKDHIFLGNKRWESSDLEEVMFTALRKDCVDFVKLFLENGLNLKEFLTKDRLRDLYKRVNIYPNKYSQQFSYNLDFLYCLVVTFINVKFNFQIPENCILSTLLYRKKVMGIDHV